MYDLAVTHYTSGKRLLKILKLLRGIWHWFRSVSKKLSAKTYSSLKQNRSAISWVIPGKLAVGSSPQVGDSERLAQARIKVIFSLCGNSEDTLPEDVSQNFHCLRLVLPDSRYKKFMKPAQIRAAVNIIEHSVQNQLPVFVHCLAGIERSPTVCIAYLCKHYNLDLWEALRWLKQVHPMAMPRESQLRVVQQFIHEEREVLKQRGA